MSESSDNQANVPVFSNRAVYVLGLFFVVIGLVNSTPVIPGWDDLWRTITGVEDLKTRAFATEWFYPIVFFIMMVIVALKHSMWRDWHGFGVPRHNAGSLK